MAPREPWKFMAEICLHLLVICRRSKVLRFFLEWISSADGIPFLAESTGTFSGSLSAMAEV
jgi:hypothetical protein